MGVHSVERLITVKEAADKFGISPGTVYHWLSQRKLPCVRFSARCVRFRESDLMKLIDDLASGAEYDVVLHVKDRSRRRQAHLNVHKLDSAKSEN